MLAIPVVRDQDRPAHDGRRKRACLAALETPQTVSTLRDVLRWSRPRIRSWLKVLKRGGLIVALGTAKGRRGQTAVLWVRVDARERP